MKVTECTARTLRQGEAVSELEAAGEDMEFAMSKAEDALKSIDITIRGETADSLRSIEEIIDDVADAWGALSDSQKQAVSEAMAGTQRSSMFSALIENYEKVKELRDAGLGAEGELAKANQVRVESLAGIQGQLEVTKETLYATMISDQDMMSILKGTDYLLQGLTGVVKFIKSNWIPTSTLFVASIYAADTAMRANNWGVQYLVLDKFVPVLKSTIAQFATFNARLSLSRQGLVDFAKGIKLTKLGMATLGAVAFQVGIEVYKSFKRATPSVEELRSQIQSLTSAAEEFGQASSNLEQVKADTSSMRELVKIIEDENQAHEVQQEKIKEVNDLLAQHASSYTSIESTLNNENISYEARIKLLERVAELEKQEAQKKAIEGLYSRDWRALGATAPEKMVNSVKSEVGNLLTVYDDWAKAEQRVEKYGEKASREALAYAEMMSKGVEKQKNSVEGAAIELANYYMTIKQYYEDGALDQSQYEHFLQYYKEGVEELQKVANETNLDIDLQLDIEDFMAKTTQAKTSVDDVKTKINELSSAMSEGADVSATNLAFTGLISELKKLAVNSEEAKLALQLLKSTFFDMPSDVNTLSEAIDYLNGKFKETSETANMKNLNESYLKSLESIKEAKDLLESFKDGLDVGEMRKLFDSDLLADYNGALTDTVAIQEHLNNKISELEAKGLLAYGSLMGANEEFWNSADANSEDYFNNTIKNTSTWENFTIDVNNNLAKVHATMVNSMGDNYEKYFNDVTSAYNIDLSNCKTAAEARLQIEAEAAEKIAQIRLAIAQASYDYGNVTMPDGTVVNYGEYHETPDTSKFNEAIAQIQAWKNSAIGALSQIGSFQNAVFGATSPKPGSSSSSSKDKGKDKEKQVSDLDLQIDRYYDLQDAIDDVNNALKKNQVLQNSSTGSKKAQLMKEEIKLYKEQHKAIGDLIDEQKRAEQEMAQTIKKAGGSFDANGDIKDRNQWLQRLQNQVNKLSGEAKEAKKAEVEGLMSVIKQYEELHNKTLPNTQLQYEEMYSTIRNLEKEHLEYVTDLQKNITSAYENEMKKRTEATKNEIDKQKDLLDSQYDEENYERELAAERRKLDEIQQQIDSARRDTSESGKLYLQQLMEEFAEQEKAINDMIRDREHELGQDRFDAEKDKLDKELENALDPNNIADIVNKAIASGFVTIGNETVQLNVLMSNWLNETSDGLYAVGDVLKSEMIDNLQTVKTLMQDMGILSFSGKSLTVDYGVNNQSRSIAELKPITHSTPSISIGNLMNVEGNITEDVMPQVQSMIRQAEQSITTKISDALSFK